MRSEAQTPAGPSRRRLFAASAAAVALLCQGLGLTSAAMGQQGGQSAAAAQGPIAQATLQQCVTAPVQSERSAMFSGEMTAVAGSARMSMRIEIQEVGAGETLFHTISAPGLGVWRASDSGVKSYKYLKQITNLTAPAFYRAVVRFRWLNARGHLIKSVERHTLKCDQPLPS
jgi:hypothetical protein